MSTPRSRAPPPIPPAKGSFPLDHDGECSELTNEYMKCLKQANSRIEQKCKEVAKKYLECRMEHGLMAREDLSIYGFHSSADASQNKAEDRKS